MQNKNKQNKDLEYEKTKTFFHCSACIKPFLGSTLHEVMTPGDYGSYEAGLYQLDNLEIVVLWCKRCHRQVWNSLALQSGIQADPEKPVVL